MALKPVPVEIVDQIRQKLGLEKFNRPHAILADAGDFGTVFTYLPLLPEEFKVLPMELQRHVYVIGRNRYGLVGYVPKNFELPDKVPVFAVHAVYNAMGALLELGYQVEEKGTVHQVRHSVRRDKLLELAKKKKIPIKTVVRSHA